MDSIYSMVGQARRCARTFWPSGCTLLLVLALIGFGPGAHTAAADACSPELNAPDLQGLQQAAADKLSAAISQSNALPGTILDAEAQRQAYGLDPSGASDQLIELNTMVAAALSSVDRFASPVDFDASLTTALELATPTEQQMIQVALTLPFASVLPLQLALDDLRFASRDMHSALTNANLGSSGCQTTLDACALVPLADAQALLGTTDISGPPTSQPVPEGPPGMQDGSICEYHTSLSQTHNGLVTVFVGRFDDEHVADVGMKQFQQAMGSGGGAPPFSDVAGLGDAAVRASGQLPAVTGGGRLVMMLVRRGTIVLQLTAGVLPNVGPSDLDSAVQQVVEKVLSKLV